MKDFNIVDEVRKSGNQDAIEHMDNLVIDLDFNISLTKVKRFPIYLVNESDTDAFSITAGISLFGYTLSLTVSNWLLS